jgi:type I restriction enzyme S subunit
VNNIEDLMKRLCPNGVRTASLGDLGVIFGGLTGKSKADFSGGNARFVSYVNVFNNIAVDLGADDFVHIEPGERQRTLARGDIVFTGSSETPDEVGMSSVVTSEVDEPLYLNSFCIGFRLNDPSLLDPDFAKYLFRSTGMRQQIVRTASGVTRFNVSKARLAKIVIPLPPVEVQREVSRTLDLFTSLQVELETELEARRRQYEYYRDKLSTFEEAEA